MHRRNYKGKKFGREKGPRRALLRNLATSVLLYEKVKTTKTKAKEVQPIVERLITLAKKGDLSAIKKLHSYLLDKKAILKLQTELAPVYKERNGGYTRVLNLGFRDGDGAPEAMIELLDTEKILKENKNEKVKAKKSNSDLSSVKAKEDKKTEAKKKDTKVETKSVKKEKKETTKKVVKK